MTKRVTVRTFQDKSDQGEKIVVLTAYDHAMALALDNAGVDALLVGDSLSMTMLGRETTLEVKIDEMIPYVRSVVHATQRAMVIADMPFLTYQSGPAQALVNAGRFLQEAGAQAVKLEWCPNAVADTRFLVQNGIPVMGHIGFTPQQIHVKGGPRVQGKASRSASTLVDQAKAFEKAGAFAVVLELIPSDLAKRITRALHVPTIGIGAGPHCDGQVQVIHDLLGLLPNFKPKHAKAYLHLHEVIRDAARRFASDVRNGTFNP